MDTVTARRIVLVDSNATNCTIGGSTSVAGNVISGNNTGLIVSAFGATDNLIQGNLIGTDESGTNPLGNSYIGIDDLGSGNTIGGTAVGEGNVIASNGSDGIALPNYSASGNLIERNEIGGDSTGTIALGNSGWGVKLYSQSSGNTIGGTTAGAQRHRGERGRWDCCQRRLRRGPRRGEFDRQQRDGVCAPGQCPRWRVLRRRVVE